MNNINRDNIKGNMVKVKFMATPPPSFTGETLLIEDLWLNVNGTRWLLEKENPACLIFSLRVMEYMETAPFKDGLEEAVFIFKSDNAVYYGKDKGGMGHLIHETEIETIL